jgi:hypothetical protein
MNKKRKSTRQSSALIEQALAHVRTIRALADDMTEALGLPEHYRYAVLSGLAPLLIEDYWQGETASPTTSREESDAPEEHHEADGDLL